MDDCGFDGACDSGSTSAALIGVGPLFDAGQNGGAVRSASRADAWLTGLVIALCLALAIWLVASNAGSPDQGASEQRDAIHGAVPKRSAVLFLPA